MLGNNTEPSLGSVLLGSVLLGLGRTLVSDKKDIKMAEVLSNPRPLPKYQSLFYLTPTLSNTADEQGICIVFVTSSVTNDV